MPRILLCLIVAAFLSPPPPAPAAPLQGDLCSGGQALPDTGGRDPATDPDCVKCHVAIAALPAAPAVARPWHPGRPLAVQPAPSTLPPEAPRQRPARGPPAPA